MIRIGTTVAVSILTIALGLGAWLAPARGATPDGEIIFIDGCGPNKLQIGDECVFVEDLFRWGGAVGSEPIPAWGLVIHVPGGGGSGPDGSEPTDESCHDEYTDCVNDCWTAFDHCEEMAGLSADHILTSTGWSPTDPGYAETREGLFAGLRLGCNENMNWDRKQCETWEKACVKQVRRR